MGCGASKNAKDMDVVGTKLVPQEPPKYVDVYAVLGVIGAKDPKATLKMITDEGPDQLNAEPNAPSWLVLGTEEGKGSDEGDKCYWVAVFNDRDAYHTDHKVSVAAEERQPFQKGIFACGATGNPMQDMAGTNMGTTYALNFDKVGSNMAKNSDAFEFCVLSRFDAKDAEAADKVVEALRTKRAAAVAANPEFKRSCIVPEKLGEQPGASQTETVYVKWWKSKSSYEKSVKLPGGKLSMDEGLLAEGSDATGAGINFVEALSFAR